MPKLIIKQTKLNTKINPDEIGFITTNITYFKTLSFWRF